MDRAVLLKKVSITELVGSNPTIHSGRLVANDRLNHVVLEGVNNFCLVRNQ